MSQTSTDAQIVAEFQNIVTGSGITFSMTAFVAYEYIITLEQETTMVWRRKWSLATWLFISNRYLLIGFTIWTVAPATSSNCAPGQVVGNTLIVLQYVIFAVFSALRVFALWNRKIPMTLLVLALNLVPVATDIFAYTWQTTFFAEDPIFGTVCGQINDLSSSVNFELSLGTRVTLIVGDVLVLAVTWVKTARNLTEGARIGMRTPLSTMLFRDGTIYFVILFVMNIAQVVVRTVPSFANFGFVTTVIGTLQAILISRFLLNLRQVGSPEIDSQEGFNSRFSVPGFRVPTLTSIVGNMGEDLDHGGPTEEVDDETEDISGSVQAEDVEAENTSGSVQSEEVALPEITI